MLRDVALVLLAVVTVAAAAYVLTGSSPAPVQPDPGPAAPSVQRTPAPEPEPEDVRALFLGGDLLLGEPGLAELVGNRLGWDVTVDAVPGSGYVAGDPGQRYSTRLTAALPGQEPDVVVLASSGMPTDADDARLFGGNVQLAVSTIRQALPDARIVLLGPVAADPEAAPVQREVLAAVAARFGAFYVDPTGRGYVAGRPELVNADGSLTAEGAQVVADRLAAELQAVLPATVLPSPAP